MLAKKDFIELELIGKIANTNQVFTEQKDAKICLGAGQLLPEIEKALEGKEITQSFELTLTPEQAFGQRNPKLVQLVPMSKFAENKINPVPGLQVTINNLLATIKSVNSGRVIIDFNHPLAGKTLNFYIKIKRKIDNLEDKIKILLPESEEVKIFEDKVEIKTKKPLPDKFIELKIKNLKEFIPELQQKEIVFLKEEKKSTEKKNSKKKKEEIKADKKPMDKEEAPVKN
ncbi:MAG: peptidylprolyl isomerase [Candidatus Nanoarchaeia archaeon]